MSESQIADPLIRALHQCESQSAEIKRLRRHLALLSRRCTYKGGIAPITYKQFVVNTDRHVDLDQWRFCVDAEPGLYYASEYSFSSEHDAKVAAYNLVDFVCWSSLEHRPGSWDLI